MEEEQERKHEQEIARLKAHVARLEEANSLLRGVVNEFCEAGKILVLLERVMARNSARELVEAGKAAQELSSASLRFEESRHKVLEYQSPRYRCEWLGGNEASW